ncbi:subtilisin-like protease SBT3.9 [Ananas comosus]|uniref:Subtilisin-like protease SBT3.5 n=1 Tax=Ananas comosus TaxID=4615 RepID=A0A199W0Q4_ANACO|nr:subtilisin-like protease SBT3.9 [Ananas comosus]OAY82859.1 Subtilisin-like protease SBT3.5 [Ananas comosus]
MNASPSPSPSPSSSRFLLFVSFFVVVFFLALPVTSISAPMADEHAKLPPEEAEAEAEAEEAKVQIVYVDRPEGADPEEFHIRTLGAVLGSEEAAKEAVIYHYMHAASGFSAKLTLKQVEELQKQAGVLQVVPSRTYQLHGPSTATQRISII